MVSWFIAMLVALSVHNHTQHSTVQFICFTLASLLVYITLSHILINDHSA